MHEAGRDRLAGTGPRTRHEIRPHVGGQPREPRLLVIGVGLRVAAGAGLPVQIWAAVAGPVVLRTLAGPAGGAMALSATGRPGSGPGAARRVAETQVQLALPGDREF